MRKYRKSPERSRKTVLISTFKNDLPENQFVLMNTVRRTQIFTAGLLNLDGHYIFPFSHSEETQKAKPAVWNSATAVKQWNIIQKELTNFQIMARVFLSTHLIQWWWFQSTMKTDVCFLGIWSHYEMEALTKALLVPNIWQFFFFPRSIFGLVSSLVVKCQKDWRIFYAGIVDDSAAFCCLLG